MKANFSSIIDRFTNFEDIFGGIDEPDYTVELASDVDVGLLLPKDRFDWSDGLNRSLLEPVSSSTFAQKLHIKTR